MTPQGSLLTADEVAAECKVDPETVRRWAREGKIESIPLPGGRLIRFRRSDIEALIAGEHRGRAAAADSADGA